ncbi:MAG: hypothetical protein ABIS43_17125 [Opitutus sp.]
MADGLPTGFDPIGETVVQASPALVGDLVTLGHGTILSCLSLRDAPGRAGGNVLVVSSRSPADIVSATILECEIFNPNMPGIGPQGPVGRALAVITRNLNFANPPPPHEQSAMTVRMTRTLVRTVQSNPAFCSGVWAHNFASHCTIKLTLTDNVLGGGIELIGGNSRPEAVAGSSVDLDSRQNLYRSDTVVPQPIGWTFIGGTIAPVPGVPGPSTNNRVQVLSVDDRIEGFQTAIFATGARRPSLVAPPVQGNQVLLSVHGAQLSSLTRDLMLRGAESFAGPVGVDTNNSVHVVLSNSVGSGVRANLYTHGTEQGAGNQLEIVGSSRSFAHSNEQILPAPDAEFFSSSR